MIYRAINGLIRHAIEADLITNDDIFVVRNQLMDILKLTDWNDKEPLTGNIEELLEPLIDYAVKARIIEDTSVQRDLFDTRVMGVFTPMPREVNATFQRKYSASPSAATEWYYAFSKSLNYVRAERIAKDLKWTKEIATDDKIASHAIWASEILKKYSDFNADNAMDIIRYEVGRVFEQVLEDAGVFKRDKQGKEAFARFVEQLG